MSVEDFGNQLFSDIANHHYKQTIEENPDSSTEKPGTSEKNLGSEDGNFEDLNSEKILLAVSMLSYVYGYAFRERFREVRTILGKAEENCLIYVRCFAEVLHEKYSPLKFLIVCSFISEIYLCFSNISQSFLSFSNDVALKKKHYVQRTTEALTDVFHNIFEKDFPQNRWADIRNKALEIGKEFSYLAPFMLLESKQFGALETALAITRKMSDDEYESQPVDTALNEVFHVILSAYSPDDPISQRMANIPVTEVPVLSPDGLPINQTVYPPSSENLVDPKAYTFSFGTVDQDPELSHLLQFSGYQTEAVTFENEPSRTEPRFQNVVEAAEPFNIDSQENLAVRSFDDGPEPSSRTVTPTENGKSEHCAEDNTIASDDSGPFFHANKKTEKESERGSDISVQEPTDAGKHDPESATLSTEDDPESATLSTEDDPKSATLSTEEDPESAKFSTDDPKSATPSTEDDPESAKLSTEEDPESAKLSTEEDPESAKLSTEENPECGTLSAESDPESSIFLKEDSYGESSNETTKLSKEENVSDPENAEFPNEENVNDPKSETFSKEDTMANGSAVNVLENQSETL